MLYLIVHNKTENNICFLLAQCPRTKLEKNAFSKYYLLYTHCDLYNVEGG